jgi:hypothetical protein
LGYESAYGGSYERVAATHGRCNELATYCETKMVLLIDLRAENEEWENRAIVAEAALSFWEKKDCETRMVLLADLRDLRAEKKEWENRVAEADYQEKKERENRARVASRLDLFI